MHGIQPARFLTDAGHVQPGVRKVVQVSTPAAGSDWTVTVPGGVMWRVSTGYATFTTDATVANRYIGSAVTVNGVKVWQIQSSTAVTASSYANVTYDPLATIVPSYANTNRFLMPLPTSPLPQGSIIGSYTNGIDGSDQWGPIALLVEEYWFTDPQLSEMERGRELVQDQIERYELQQAQTGQQG